MRNLKRGLLVMFGVTVTLLVVAAAANVTIIKTAQADYAGVFLKPYYENANAPVTGCTAPCLTVDTQATEPVTSGSFSLAPAATAATMYLWSPQFATATSIPAGSLSLQLFADAPAPALDGTVTGVYSASVLKTASLTTTKTNDLIVVSITTYSSGASVTVTKVTDSLNFIVFQSSARSSVVYCSGAQEITNIEWYGVAAHAVSGDAISITLSSAPTAASAIAFGVSGADTTTPFDPASGLPKTASACANTNSAPTVSGVSTRADTDFASRSSEATVR